MPLLNGDWNLPIYLLWMLVCLYHFSFLSSYIVLSSLLFFLSTLSLNRSPLLVYFHSKAISKLLIFGSLKLSTLIFIFIVFSFFFSLFPSLLFVLKNSVFIGVTTYSRMDQNQLTQVESLCVALYKGTSSSARTEAQKQLLMLQSTADFIPQCQFILDNSILPYAQLVASSSLENLVRIYYFLMLTYR